MALIPKPYGTWPSPVTSELLTSSSITLAEICFSDGHVYWAEGRPMEKGRIAIVCDGSDVLPPNFNARTRAHEYGGGAYVVHHGVVFFSNFEDQRLYRVDAGAPPRAITPEPPTPGSLRYTDTRVSPNGRTLVCVRERHEANHEAINELVALPADGSAEPRIVAGNHDFIASPRFSPDGRKLAWLTWDHPNMPWDGTELWVGAIAEDGSISNPTKIAGGVSESIFQPEWSPEGVLHFISDRSGWWQLYTEQRQLTTLEAEFGLPQWVFNLSRYGFLSEGRLACVYSRNGVDNVAILDTRSGANGALQPLALAYTAYSDLRTDGDSRVFLIAGSPTSATAVVEFSLRDNSARILKSSTSLALDPGDLSTPESIEYPTTRGRTAHALYYPPRNKSYTGSAGEKPPLLVMSHGGPTSAATPSLKLLLQFWTSRGFAVVDVNYGGSSGYGREYRERLNGTWGIVDVEDCIEAAHYLAGRGDVDPKRMAIRGGSAGGYTTLCALVFHNVFAAGASHYGVGDLTALAVDTHKFESRYLDKLIGPYPAAAGVYRERSPVLFADRISCPVILFQGLDDKVVPPSQAETFIAALQAKGLPYEYVSFPGEGHGFRSAEAIRRVADEELAFYTRIFELR